MLHEFINDRIINSHLIIMKPAALLLLSIVASHSCTEVILLGSSKGFRDYLTDIRRIDD